MAGTTKFKFKVLMVAFPILRTRPTPEEFLKQASTISNLIKIYQLQSIKLSIFISFHTNHQIEHGGGSIHFIREEKSYISSFRNLYKAIEFVDYDILHLHNFLDGKNNLKLLRKIGPKVPVLIQHHGEMPPTGLLKKVLVKKLLDRVDSILFAAPGQEEAWVDRGIIKDKNKCTFCWEDFSKFEKLTTEMKAKTLNNPPIILWVANLDRNKDPLTALRGFELFLHENKARMRMIYRGTGLEKEVKQKIAGSTLLAEHVELVGALSPEDLFKQFQLADYILQASHKEGSGYSITEALSLGLIPILSDIPSFRLLSREGEIGALFIPGNASSIKKALVDALTKNYEEQQKLSVLHYQQNFSSWAIAKRMELIYSNLPGK